MSEDSKHIKLAHRLADILISIINRKNLDTKILAERYGVSERTIQRDKNRLDKIIKEKDNNSKTYTLISSNHDEYYRLDNLKKLIYEMGMEDLFLPISEEKFIEKLLGGKSSFYIKKVFFEKIHSRQVREQLIKKLDTAINQHTQVVFKYKNKDKKICPYLIVLCKGIWYLNGVENGKLKSFCLYEIKSLINTQEKFIHNEKYIKKIKDTPFVTYLNDDDIPYEVTLIVSKEKAIYFKRRDLLPEQTTKEYDDGRLLVKSKAPNQEHIIPLLQWWLPDIEIISPPDLKAQLIKNCKNFIENNK